MKLMAHPAEVRTLLYMVVTTWVAIAHWMHGTFSPLLFAAALLLSFAVSAMNHNHSHRPIWRCALLNRASDLWFTVFQGHPGYVFEPMHVDNHHRFHNGAGDVTRTDRFRSGNDLFGLVVHPFEFAAAASPKVVARLREMARDRPRALAGIYIHYLALVVADGITLWLDWRAALYVVLMPQGAAMFWLLASNYLQHAHTDGDSEFNHSRNFLGLINPLVFNVGYHTAHHFQPECHWSELPAVHKAITPRVASALNEPSFAGYMFRVFLLALVFRRFRSRPLAASLSRESQHGQ